MADNTALLDSCPFADCGENLDTVFNEYFKRIDDNDSSATELSDGDDTDDESTKHPYDPPSDNEESVNVLHGYKTFINEKSEPVECDADENERIRKFIDKTCGCKLGDQHLACSTSFKFDEIVQLRVDAKTLDYYDQNHCNRLDLTILAQLRSLTSGSACTKATKRVSDSRLKVRTTFMLLGMRVCRVMFLFANALSLKRFRRLLSTYINEGMTEKKHGNAERVPQNKLFQDKVADVVNLIRVYAEQNALFLPGRQPGYFKRSAKLLPTSDSKSRIYTDIYVKSCPGKSYEPVSLRSFRRIWRKFCPEIVTTRPKTDLCKFCQENFTLNKRMGALSEAEKLQTVKQMEAHLNKVAVERKYYNDTIALTKEHMKLCTEPIMPSIPNSYHGEGHHSFDMAQLVSLPYNAQQKGPIYFLNGFKISIFGIMNDTWGKQYNYLIPESVTFPKSSSYIVSILHHYFEHFTHGETDLLLHANNCGWQKKNFALISYLNWRIVTRKNRVIKLSFMPSGHTKFSCDWAFGKFKQLYRRSEAYSLADVAEIIRKSTPVSDLNNAIVISDEKGVDLNIPFFAWCKYFQELKWNRIPDISKCYHFEFTSRAPGFVNVRRNLDNLPTKVFIGSLLSPEVVLQEEISNGLPLTRQKYLFEKIREFCPDRFKDTLCPSPNLQVDLDSIQHHLDPGNPEIVSEPECKRSRPWNGKEGEDADFVKHLDSGNPEIVSGPACKISRPWNVREGEDVDFAKHLHPDARCQDWECT